MQSKAGRKFGSTIRTIKLEDLKASLIGELNPQVLEKHCYAGHTYRIAVLRALVEDGCILMPNVVSTHKSTRTARRFRFLHKTDIYDLNGVLNRQVDPTSYITVERYIVQEHYVACREFVNGDSGARHLVIGWKENVDGDTVLLTTSNVHPYLLLEDGNVKDTI